MGNETMSDEEIRSIFRAFGLTEEEIANLFKPEHRELLKIKIKLFETYAKGMRSIDPSVNPAEYYAKHSSPDSGPKRH